MSFYDIIELEREKKFLSLVIWLLDFKKNKKIFYNNFSNMEGRHIIRDKMFKMFSNSVIWKQ